MSTIVAVKKNGEVAIAADTLPSTYGLKISAQYKVRRQKILCFQDTYLGFVGYSVHKKVFESIIDKHPGDLNFASSRHIFETFNKIHPILKEKFYLTPAEDDTYESSDMRILVANPSGIFQVDEDRHVLELEHFWAIGSGPDFALGAAPMSSANILNSQARNRRAMTTGLHEEFSREHAVEAASNKRFGLVVGAILLLFGCIRAYLHSEIGWFAALLGGVGLVLILAALIKPDALEPANRGWNKLGLLLHKVTNPIFLGGMYVVAIVPTGLMMRAFGVDPMGLRRPRGASYWIARGKGGSTAQSLEKPF